jgi:hypothetical protein
MESFEFSVEAAVIVLLSYIEWAELEVQGFDDLIDWLRILHRAVTMARVAEQHGNKRWMPLGPLVISPTLAESVICSNY